MNYRKPFFVLLAGVLLLSAAPGRSQTFENPSIQGSSSFAVITDSRTARECRPQMTAYKQTLEAEGLPVYIVSHDWTTPEQVRDVLRKLYAENALEGCVFIGDVPIAMITKAQHLTSAFKMDERDHPLHETSVPSDRFYDDNVWLGIDFCDIYEATGDKKYLAEAEMIWKFIESGTDDVLGGGIYWCEQQKHSKNTCSNAPGTVYALKLYAATGDERYLARGKALYAWTKEHLLDPEDGLYFDNIGLDGRIGRAKFAYNSGQMVQAGALLYKATGDESYLKDAQRTAAACYDRFFGEFTPQGGETFRIIDKGNVWFSAVMVRGLAELYAIDGNAAYLGDVQRTLDYAWEHARDAQGLFETDFTGADKQSEKWLLTQGAMAEMYGRMSGVKLDQTK